MVSNIFNNLNDVEDILKIYIPFSDMNDKRVWPFTKDENLSNQPIIGIMIG